MGVLIRWSASRSITAKVKCCRNMRAAWMLGTAVLWRLPAGFFKIYSHDLALHEKMKICLFSFGVTFMGIILRGCMSFFLHRRFAVNILDQSPFAGYCSGSPRIKDKLYWHTHTTHEKTEPAQTKGLQTGVSTWKNTQTHGREITRESREAHCVALWNIFDIKLSILYIFFINES